MDRDPGQEATQPPRPASQGPGPSYAHAPTLSPRSPALSGLLNHRYSIEREIGRGGFGIVYLARDTQLLSRPVVVKVLREETSHDPWLKKKFRQEVEALARIDHPGIVGILDAGEVSPGRPFFVMQYVDGRTLRAVMPPEGMNLGRAAGIIRKAADALSAAHDQGVFHRDLKPENIMVRKLGEGEELIKIIDFGIAAVLRSQVESGFSITRFAGSPAYMAPEQLMGEPTAASDIYALGVIAYEMLAGRRPFESGNPLKLYELQRLGAYPKLSEVRGIPADAERAVLRALSFKAVDRYRRVRDFGEDLARALSASDQAAAKPSPRIREPNLGCLVPKTCDRNRQVTEFADHFLSNLKHLPGTPQAYFVRGAEGECHDSLVERLVGIQIKPTIERMFGAHSGAVLFRKLGWAYDGEPEFRQRELKRMLFAEFDPAYMSDDLSAAALGSLASATLLPCIVIQHRIHAARWDAGSSGLIDWYLGYLSGLQARPGTSWFVVFLSIIHPRPGRAFWTSLLSFRGYTRKQIDGQVRRICASAVGCPCLLLSELQPLRQEDVKDWFSIHNIKSEKTRLDLMREMFRLEDGTLAESRHMAEVEHRLQLLLESMQGEFLTTRSFI